MSTLAGKVAVAIGEYDSESLFYLAEPDPALDLPFGTNSASI
jgi:hypothetical protein